MRLRGGSFCLPPSMFRPQTRTYFTRCCCDGVSFCCCTLYVKCVRLFLRVCVCVRACSFLRVIVYAIIPESPSHPTSTRLRVCAHITHTHRTPIRFLHRLHPIRPSLPPPPSLSPYHSLPLYHTALPSRRPSISLLPPQHKRSGRATGTKLTDTRREKRATCGVYSRRYE